jgi:RNA polymerase sigma-70 factor, ECF subfamily
MAFKMCFVPVQGDEPQNQLAGFPMSDLPTTQGSLLSRIVNRDDRASWEEFVRLYSPVLRRVATGRGLRNLDADEFVQDVLVVVMSSIETFDRNNRRGSFRRWLMTLARNTAINKMTRRSVDQRQRHNAFPLEQLTRNADQSDAIAQVLEREWQSELFSVACIAVRPSVQPLNWSAFWKTAVEGSDAKSVASELGMSLGAVYVARSRTLAKLKAWVANNSSLWKEES